MIDRGAVGCKFAATGGELYLGVVASRCEGGYWMIGWRWSTGGVCCGRKWAWGGGADGGGGGGVCCGGGGW